MGENVKFKVKHVCEGDDQLIAAANWHLGTNFHDIIHYQQKKERVPLKGYLQKFVT